MKILAIFNIVLSVPVFCFTNYTLNTDVIGPKTDYVPRTYLCYYTAGNIVIDGKPNDPSWDKAEWTEYFTDIEGNLKPEPYYSSRVKMLWDDKNMYFYAEMEEEHLWATLEERDAVIYKDNDFEIFIDPDGDTHNYYEFEFNIFGTLWDLLLTRPYRDNGQAVDAWDARDVEYSVWTRGTINNPSDTDKGWSIEVAIPWKVLEECASHNGPPEEKEQWKINFSRVQWKTDVTGGSYVKKEGVPENNWVWSPQGLIAMHYPEMWGIVQFESVKKNYNTFEYEDDEEMKWNLRQAYYLLKKYKNENKRFPYSMNELKVYFGADSDFIESIKNLSYIRTETSYEISAEGKENKWYIRADGKLWSE